MGSIIFYGAGKYAEHNFSRWIKNNLVPVCFSDADKNKHGKSFGDGGVMIHPLDYAVSHYPDYEIYLTVGVDALGKVTKYLLNEKNIPRVRIKYPDAVETRRGCKLIGTRIQFFSEKIGTCCKRHAVTISYSGNFEENFDNYRNFCTDLISKLRLGEKTVCDDCVQLREDIWPVEPRLELIGLGPEAFEDDECNFNCVFCENKKRFNKSPNKFTLIEMIRSLEQMSKGERLNIVLASGEIAISPYRDEVFDIIRNNSWKVDVFTNASVFIGKLADLLYAGYARIQVSMDAGTPATFAKIKGVDCWEKVVSVLQKYAAYTKSAGQIELKYIFLRDINDNKADIDGFIELAERLNADVVISSEEGMIDVPLPEKTIKCVARLMEICRDRGIRFGFATEHFNPGTYEKLTAQERKYVETG